MAILGDMHCFWSEFIFQSRLLSENPIDETEPDKKLLQDMLSFIHQHYIDKIALEDIAASGNICRIKCCTIFKSITDIALYCGFSSSSYFTQLFRKLYSCTPGEYRSQI